MQVLQMFVRQQRQQGNAGHTYAAGENHHEEGGGHGVEDQPAAHDRRSTQEQEYHHPQPQGDDVDDRKPPARGGEMDGHEYHGEDSDIDDIPLVEERQRHAVSRWTEWMGGDADIDNHDGLYHTGYRGGTTVRRNLSAAVGAFEDNIETEIDSERELFAQYARMKTTNTSNFSLYSIPL